MLHFAEPPHPGSMRLGAILAGGQSRRFGSLKQLATVGGTRMIERVADALRAAGARPVLISGPHVPDLSHILPCRQDLRPGHGPLAGLHTALAWAGELGVPGALCVACDLPLVSAPLLRRLAEVGEIERDSLVAPESHGPLGVEPLCAWYPVSAAREVELRLDNGALSIAELLGVLPLRRLPLAEVAGYGNPEAIFLNVNTPADRDRAVTLETGREGEDERH